MAKKKKKELIDESEPIGIESRVRLDKLELKECKWLCKLRIGTTLPKAYHLYKILMELDEKPYLDRIEDLEAQVKGTLFENVKAETKKLDDAIARVKKDLRERRKECEKIEFNAQVEELKYSSGDTVITLSVPDDIIEPFNRQKTRLSYYKIILNPLYEKQQQQA